MNSGKAIVGGVIVTVNYRSADFTVAFLGSLAKLKRFPELAIRIVDNASGNHSSSRIREASANLSNVTLLESAKNLGYFGAARWALADYLERNASLPDWVIVCNNDIVIEDQEFLEKLFGLDPQAVGMIAPGIHVAGTNVNQNPFMRRRPGWLRRFTMRLYTFAYSLAVAWTLLSQLKRAVKSWFAGPRVPAVFQEKESLQTIYAAHGAFLIFSRRFFEAGGYLDNRLFLFGEEIAAAETCRALHLPVLYHPKLSVVHHEHRSLGTGMTRRIYECHREAVRYVLATYLTPQ